MGSVHDNGRSIRLELHPRDVAALEQVARLLDAPSLLVVLEELIRLTVTGVERPGSWERGWLEKLLGPMWAVELDAPT